MAAGRRTAVAMAIAAAAAEAIQRLCIVCFFEALSAQSVLGLKSLPKRSVMCVLSGGLRQKQEKCIFEVCK